MEIGDVFADILVLLLQPLDDEHGLDLVTRIYFILSAIQRVSILFSRKSRNRSSSAYLAMATILLAKFVWYCVHRSNSSHEWTINPQFYNRLINLRHQIVNRAHLATPQLRDLGHEVIRFWRQINVHLARKSERIKAHFRKFAFNRDRQKTSTKNQQKPYKLQENTDNRLIIRNKSA